MRSTTLLQHLLIQRLSLALLLSTIILIYIGSRVDASEAKKDLVNCAEWATGNSQCYRTQCSGSFTDMLGIWDGRYQINDETFTEFRPLESRQVFSKNGCYLNTSGSESYLVGKQTDYYPAYKNLAERRTEKLVVYIKSNAPNTMQEVLRFVNSAGEFNDYKLKELNSRTGERVWTNTASDSNLITLKEDPYNSKGREIDIKLTSLAGDKKENTLMKGFKKNFRHSETAFFSGSAWLINSRGTPVAIEKVALKTEFDPITGILVETEVTTDGGHYKVSNTTAYVMTRENPGISESSSVSEAGYADGTKIELYNFKVGKHSYDEQRFYGSDGKLMHSRVRTMAKVDYNDFSKLTGPGTHPTRP